MSQDARFARVVVYSLTCEGGRLYQDCSVNVTTGGALILNYGRGMGAAYGIGEWRRIEASGGEPAPDERAGAVTVSGPATAQ